MQNRTLTDISFHRTYF